MRCPDDSCVLARLPDMQTGIAPLDALLAQSDTAAMALFEEHAVALRAALGAQGEQLGRAIGRFEFEAARDTMRAARLQLEESEKRK